MLLQHLKRRGTQIDLPLILGTTGMYTDWYIPALNEARNICSSMWVSASDNLSTFIGEPSVSSYITSSERSINRMLTARLDPNSTGHPSGVSGLPSQGVGDVAKGNSFPEFRYIYIRKTNTTAYVLRQQAEGGYVGYIGSDYSLIFIFTPLSILTTGVPQDQLYGINDLDDGQANTTAWLNIVNGEHYGYVDNYIAGPIELPVINSGTTYKLDIDWGDGNKIRYENTGANLFGDSFTYTEGAFSDIIDLTPISESNYEITNNNVITSGDSFVFDGTSSYVNVKIPKPINDLDNFILEFEFNASELLQYDANGTCLINIHSNTNDYTDDLNVVFKLVNSSTRAFGLNLLTSTDMTFVETGTANINGVNEWNKVKLILNSANLELTLNDTVVHTEPVNSNWVWINNPQSILRIGKTGSDNFARHFKGEIKNIYFSHFSQPDIKIWARNGADNNLNFNRTSWLTYGDTLIREGDMSKEPLDIGIDANQNGIPDDWE